MLLSPIYNQAAHWIPQDYRAVSNHNLQVFSSASNFLLRVCINAIHTDDQKKKNISIVVHAIDVDKLNSNTQNAQKIGG